jgi:GxxExxY protein
MEIEVELQGIPYKSHAKLQIAYKGRYLKKEYEADMITHNQLLVEFKSLDRLGSIEEAQVLNYLKATGYRVGLLINFGHPSKLDWKRLVK